VTPDQFYFGLLSEIVTQIQEQTACLMDWKFEQLDEWWLARERLPFVQRWRAFIEDIVLVEVPQKIVVFLDEIDSVLGLSFRSDDFFAAIRESYNRRVDRPDYQRLTFALLAVCTPQDLIQDKRRTPFNIGEAIELAGFTPWEADALAPGLPGGSQTLDEVLTWTGGQPFLTQRVCRLVGANPSLTVAQVVQTQVIAHWESQDEQVHFRTIQDRLMADEGIAPALLGLYQRILAEAVASDGSPEQLALRLTGLVVKRDNRVRPLLDRVNGL
jgi:AAA-like domain